MEEGTSSDSVSLLTFLGESMSRLERNFRESPFPAAATCGKCSE